MKVCKKKGNQMGSVLGEGFFRSVNYVTNDKGMVFDPLLASKVDSHDLVEHAIAFMEDIDGRRALEHFDSELGELSEAVRSKSEEEVLEEVCDVIVTSLRASRSRGLDIGFQDVLHMVKVKLRARRPGYTSDVNEDVERVLNLTEAALSDDKTHIPRLK